LARGYAVVRDDGGRTLHSSASVKPAAKLSIEFTDGKVAVKAEGGGGQGSLF
jgi:exodeoxyribonuclease VII large subunit